MKLHENTIQLYEREKCVRNERIINDKTKFRIWLHTTDAQRDREIRRFDNI